MRINKDFIEILKKTVEDHQGILRTQELYELGLNYRNIDALVRDGTLYRVKNGYYSMSQGDFSQEEQIHGLFSDGVLCLHTALYYYGYLEERPFCWQIAVDKNTSKSRFRLEYPVVAPSYTEPEILTLGQTRMEISGLTFRIYDRDRVICDCLKYADKFEHEELKQALRGYLADPKKNIQNLNKYARIRKVTEKVQNVIGVWL